MYRDKRLIKHVLEQKTIAGAKKYSIIVFCCEWDRMTWKTVPRRKGDLGNRKHFGTKQPGARILVSGILPRWKRNAADGMNFKNKQNVQNGKMKGYLGCPFCPQDNFSKHMFYDGTHLNTEGTAQHVRNYKYMIGKTTFNRGRYPTFVEKTNQGTASTYEQRE